MVLYLINTAVIKFIICLTNEAVRTIEKNKGQYIAIIIFYMCIKSKWFKIRFQKNRSNLY